MVDRFSTQWTFCVFISYALDHLSWFLKGLFFVKSWQISWWLDEIALPHSCIWWLDPFSSSQKVIHELELTPMVVSGFQAKPQKISFTFQAHFKFLLMPYVFMSSQPKQVMWSSPESLREGITQMPCGGCEQIRIQWSADLPQYIRRKPF